MPVISAAIFTFNEEVNLPFCLASLNGCDDVVVVDSFSVDRTCEMARERGARVFQHEFTGFGEQRMWALENVDFKHPWVLILDADEQVTPALWEEIKKRVSSCSEEVSAFRLKRRFFWRGVWLRYSNLYPTWVVRLIRIGRVRYVNRGHAETQRVEGCVESLREDLWDENHKGIGEWRARQEQYAEQEARYEAAPRLEGGVAGLWNPDPLRRRAALKGLARFMPFRGCLYFIYAYVLRSGWRDGWMGLRFCFEKARFQSMTAKRARQIWKARA